PCCGRWGSERKGGAMSGHEQLRDLVQASLHAGIADQIARQAWDGPTVAVFQQRRLRTLLGHAIANSPFHAERLKGVDPDRFELADLARLPVMTKSAMMARFDEAVTDRRLTLDLVEQTLAATDQHPIPLFGRHMAYATGGSSGVRGVFVWD